MTGRLTLKCEAGKRNCCCLWKEPKPNQNCNLQSRSQIHEIDIIPNTVKLVYWVDHTILYTSHLSCTILQVGRGSTRDEVVFLLFFFYMLCWASIQKYRWNSGLSKSQYFILKPPSLLSWLHRAFPRLNSLWKASGSLLSKASAYGAFRKENVLFVSYR